MKTKLLKNCFDEFGILPLKNDDTVSILFEYEKHYLELIKKYKQEIEFIENMLRDYRAEILKFNCETLPLISKKLQEDKAISAEMREVWLKRLADNMERSFSFSENLINEFATKKLNEFKTAVNEKIKSM